MPWNLEATQLSLSPVTSGFSTGYLTRLCGLSGNRFICWQDDGVAYWSNEFTVTAYPNPPAMAGGSFWDFAPEPGTNDVLCLGQPGAGNAFVMLFNTTSFTFSTYLPLAGIDISSIERGFGTRQLFYVEQPSGNLCALVGGTPTTLFTPAQAIRGLCMGPSGKLMLIHQAAVTIYDTTTATETLYVTPPPDAGRIFGITDACFYTDGNGVALGFVLAGTYSYYVSPYTSAPRGYTNAFGSYVLNTNINASWMYGAFAAAVSGETGADDSFFGFIQEDAFQFESVDASVVTPVAGAFPISTWLRSFVDYNFYGQGYRSYSLIYQDNPYYLYRLDATSPVPINNGSGVLISRRHVVFGAGTVGHKKDIVIPPLDESDNQHLAIQNPGMGFNEREIPHQEIRP